jgi:hypothetical protein
MDTDLVNAILLTPQNEKPGAFYRLGNEGGNRHPIYRKIP